MYNIYLHYNVYRNFKDMELESSFRSNKKKKSRKEINDEGTDTGSGPPSTTSMTDTFSQSSSEQHLSPVIVHNYHTKLNSSLQKQKNFLSSSVDTISTLTWDLIYKESAHLKNKLKNLPTHFFKNKEDAEFQMSRWSHPSNHDKTMQFFELWCKIRRRSWLILVMGIWKIILIKAQSMANRPVYSKTAAVYLMHGWVIYMKKRYYKELFYRWIRMTKLIKYWERYYGILRLQTLCRRIIAKRYFIKKLHRKKPYFGPLADFYMAEQRIGLKFYIPHVVRQERRHIWQSVMKIQALIRQVIQYRRYQYILKCIVRIQTIVKTFLCRSFFLAFKRKVIKTQAFIRFALARLKFLRLKAATIIAQKYVRRYLCIILKWRLLWRKWVYLELRFVSVIKLQQFYLHHRAVKTRYHIINAHKQQNENLPGNVWCFFGPQYWA